MQDLDNEDILDHLRRPLRLTRAGLWAEQIVQTGWPLWTVLLVIWALLAFGVHSIVSPEVLVGGGLLSLVAVAGTAFWAVRRFKSPSEADAMLRLDLSMPGRPISAALDEQAIGAGDTGSQAVWEVHKARMRAKLENARAVAPDLRVSRQDPYGMRFVALIAFVVALGFGTAWRSDGLGGLTAGSGQALAAGPSWEVWIEPPAHTGKPSLYLNDIKVGGFDVPKDSQMIVRLYGQVGAVTLSETVSGVEVSPEDQPQTAYTLPIVQSGDIAIEEHIWSITVLEDKLPTVKIAGTIERSPEGEMQLPFEAADDYGVEQGSAVIRLDMAQIDRRYGLALDPEPQEQIVVDLPMPISGNRVEFTETLIENLSKHPWAALPVVIELTVQDGNDQTSDAAQLQVALPGRRFFQPIAKAVIEMRRDLLWTRDNAKRVEQLLRTITYQPEGFFTNERAYLTVRRVITRLELARGAPMDDTTRDELSEMLWAAAIDLEEGTLADALEKLRRAQEKLSDAMRDGASDEEIAELMQELSEAMQDYMQQLAEQQRQDGENQQQAENQDSQEITGDQLQEMLDEIERLMQEGEMEQAQALLDQLMEMMQNMQVAEGGQGGQGQGSQSPGEQAMEGLQETLRDQQGLSDEAFRELQEQFNPGAQAGENEGNEGSNGNQGRGQSHEGQGGEGEQDQQQGENGQGGNQPPQDGRGGGSLADRQQSLRGELERQQRNLPSDGTPEGDAARDALDRAGEAMDRAEGALRNNDTAEALGAQSDAMDALRDGIRNLAESLAEQQQRQDGPGGEENGQASQRGRDPLGRETGPNGTIGSHDNMLGDADARRRSRELLDEIRKRSGDQERPEVERDYLRRLLDRF
ncbi:MAG: DUF4175 domain-containing protein [Litoreibacter sp.]